MSIFKPYRFYPKEEIEQRANDILWQMQQRGQGFAPDWPFEASRVADFLDLGVVWDQITPDEEGPIAARILPTRRQIEINEDILNLPQGFQESTIAHEIGHWILHIDQYEVDEVVKQSAINIGPFVCRVNSTQPQIASMEWQAQYFASCLLMPKHILQEKCQGLDLRKWSDLYLMREHLGVSISNLANRLQDLGWIYIPKGSRRIYGSKEEANRRSLDSSEDFLTQAIARVPVGNSLSRC